MHRHHIRIVINVTHRHHQLRVLGLFVLGRVLAAQEACMHRVCISRSTLLQAVPVPLEPITWLLDG